MNCVYENMNSEQEMRGPPAQYHQAAHVYTSAGQTAANPLNCGDQIKQSSELLMVSAALNL